MKRVEVVKQSEVKVTPFVLKNFTTNDIEMTVSEAVSKKELKLLAQELNLTYDDGDITFSKKLINAYIKKR